MFESRLRVTNHARWGKLVKTWATGDNYLEDGNEYPIPTSLDDFKRQVALANVGATVPPNLKKLEMVVPCDTETLIIKLPPKEELRKSEQELTKPGREYPVPDFYSRVLFGGRDPKAPVEETDIMELHAARIGDYTVSICT